MGAPFAERARFSTAPRTGDKERHSIHLRFASQSMAGSKHSASGSPSALQPAGMPPAGLLFGNASDSRPSTYRPSSSRPRDILSPRSVLRRTSSRESIGPNASSLLGLPPLNMHRGEQYTGSPMPISRAATPLWETEALAVPYSPTRRSYSVRSVSSSSSSRAPSPPPLAIRQPRASQDAYEPPAQMRAQTQSMRQSVLSNSRHRARAPSSSSSSQFSWSATSDTQTAPPLGVGQATASSTPNMLYSQGNSAHVSAPPRRRGRTPSTSYRHEAGMPAHSYATSSTGRYTDTRTSREVHGAARVHASMSTQNVAGSPASWHAPLMSAQWSPATERSTASAPPYPQPPSAPPLEGELKSWQHWYHELSPSEQYKSTQTVIARREASEPSIVSVASLDTSVKTIKEELEERDMRLRAWKKQRELEAGWREK